MKRGLLVVPALLVALASAAPGARGAAPASGPRALLDQALRRTQDARTTFRQTRTDALGAIVTRGRLEYRRSRHVRLEWFGTAAATAIVRGDTVWFYQPSQKSVLKSSAAAGGAPPALFLDESVRVLERTYHVQEQGRAGLVLTPRAGHAAWSRLTLALDPATGWPRTLTLVALDGSTTRLDFDRFQVNRGAPDARFLPRFPTGTPVVDL